MKTPTCLILGMLSSILLSVGLTRCAQGLEPLSRRLGNSLSNSVDAATIPSIPCPSPFRGFPVAMS